MAASSVSKNFMSSEDAGIVRMLKASDAIIFG